MSPSNILNLFIICLFSISWACAQGVSDGGSTQTDNAGQTPIPGAEETTAYFPMLVGKVVGCVVNHSSLIGKTHLVDSLRRAGINVRVVFAPEHGFRGTADAGAHLSDNRDPETGIPVISLYGERRKPTTADLSGLDIVVFDIQDVGVRFYTYISTMHLVMEACAEAGIPVLILDRPNPNGYYVDGPVLQKTFSSFVGMHEIPVVYGMTVGELARMINNEGWLAGALHCDLTVIPCARYDHTMTYKLPVPPSPNLPNLRSVLLYPSLCFFEGTQVSVGRGTALQFQVIGHPRYPGDYTFTPVSMPGAQHPPHEGVLLRGTDLSNISTTEIQGWKRLNLSWLIAYGAALQPADQFFLPANHFFEKLAGNADLRSQIIMGLTEEEIRAGWQPDLEKFKKIRKKYLLYPDFE